MEPKIVAETEPKDKQLVRGSNDRITMPLPPDQIKSPYAKVSLNHGQTQALEPRAPMQPVRHPMREAELSPVRSDPHLVTVHNVNPEATAQFNRLAIGLITGAAKKPPLKRILVASAHHQEGRTCVILNLATALSRAGQRVLVIDSDLMRPSVNRLLGLDTEVGLVEALVDKLPPDAALTKVLPIGFDILPTRGQVENSAEILASPDFRSLLASLDFSYDFILFDSAPLLTSADAGLLILHTHATLMVVKPGSTSTTQMAKAVSQLREDTLFGVVLNRVV